VIVTTPQAFFEQEAFDGNPYQAHRSLWTWRDFARLGLQGLRRRVLPLFR
jgi:hypothetical protein